LVAWFGCVPSFHDGEILSLHLNRVHSSRLRIHAWIGTGAVDARGYFVTDKHAVVTFTLEEIIDLQLDGFSCQNVIGALALRRAPEHPDRLPFDPVATLPSVYEIELEPCFGLSGKIRARQVRISFVPGKADDRADG